MRPKEANARSAAAVTAVAAAVFAVHALYYWPTSVDDATITFRHSRTLLAPFGAVLALASLGSRNRMRVFEGPSIHQEGP